MAAKKFARVTAALVLTTIFLSFVIYHIVNSFSAGVELFTVTHGSAKESVELTGYIFRDETVIYGGSGIKAYNVASGEKVASGESIASVMPAGSAETERRLYEIDRETKLLEKSKLTVNESIDKLDEQISAIQTMMAQNRSDASFIADKADELLILMNKKELALGEKTGFTLDIAMLQSEKASLLSSLGASTNTEAPSSGFFYSFTDGYEALFTAEEAKSITAERFTELISMTPSASADTVGKVAAGFTWYLVAKTTIEDTEQISADKEYPVLFCDNTYKSALSFKVEKKLVDYTDRSVILVMSCKSTPQNFDFSRSQRISITVNEVKGLKVPTSTVRVKDGNTGVYVLYDGIARVRNVNILAESGGYYIVEEAAFGSREWLTLYDRIIIGERDLYDGKIIG